MSGTAVRRHNRASGFALALLLALALLMVSTRLPAARADADPRPWPRMCPASNRFGVSVAGSTSILDYDVGQLHAGWYQNFSFWDGPPSPADMGFVQTIRLIDQVCANPPCDGPCGTCPGGCWPCPTWDQVQAVARANPGSLWLLGNEPDSPYQDNVTPETYARLYHDLYAFLKSQDPTCQVGIGGVVQATPLRLKYLGMILDAYQQFYRRPMPIEVWNTHNYVLREERGSWGAEIPPGLSDQHGILYDINENDLLDPSPTDPSKIGWKQQVVLLRQFMADRGYRDCPLILSEYGILMPTIYGEPPYDFSRNQAFMLATFGWMLNTTDVTVGYPADGNRLVQAWAWYSLDENTFEDFPAQFNLFDPQTKVATPLGQAYGGYTAGLTAPGIDVAPIDIRHTWPAPGAREPVSLTITADVTNLGINSASDVVVRFEKYGAPAGEVVLPSLAPGQVKPATIVLQDLGLGEWITVSVAIDPEGQIAECNSENNRLTACLLVSRHQVFFPTAIRNP